MPEKEAKKANTGLIAGIIGGVVAVVAIVVVIIIIVTSGGGKELVGKWSVYSMKEGDTEISADTLKMFGMDDAYIEFKEDGTGTMKINGQEQSFKYDGKKLTADGETKEVKVDGDKLTFEPAEGTSITFKK